MNPLNPQLILNLFLRNGIDGYYLNGHEHLCQWLDSYEDKTYYIQLLPDELGVVSYNNVRLWTSETAMIEAQKKRERIIETFNAVDEYLLRDELHPLVIQLYEACERKDFQSILGLKAQLRELRIPYDKERTKIRNLI